MVHRLVRFVGLVAAFAGLTLPASAQQTASPIQEADAQVNGITIHYLRAGHGEPIVLVHGYPESSRTWRRIIPALAASYTVIAPDTRGTGRSAITGRFELRDAAEDIHALVHRLGFRRVTLVGHDFGVQVVSAYTALHRDDVRALVVIESPLSGYGLEALYPKFWHFGFLASKLAPLLIEHNIDRFFRAFAFEPFVYRHAAFSEADIAAYIADESRPGRLDAGFEYYRALQRDEPFFRRTVAPPWRFPVLAIDGDHSFDGLTAASFAHVAPGIRRRMIAQCGHFVQEEQPQALANALLAFAASSSAPGR